MGTQTSPPGWYGKLPALGDFASRRLPQSFIAVWDAWLAGCVVPCQRGRDPDRSASDPSAPVIGFWLAQGTVGAEARIGVIAPSTDRVGRAFPFTVVAAAPLPGDTFDSRIPDDPWFRAVGDAIANWTATRAGIDRVEDDLARYGRTGAAVHAPERSSRRPLRTGSAWWRVSDLRDVLTCATLPTLDEVRRLTAHANAPGIHAGAETQP